MKDINRSWSWRRKLILAGFLIVQTACLPASSLAAPASNSIYGLTISEAHRKDLFSYFRFQFQGLTITKEGLTELHYAPPKSSLYRSFVNLRVTLDSDGGIMRLQLIVPRRFIDDERQGMLARDVVKSFVLASVPDSDLDSVYSLANEIFFRQKLTELKVGNVISESGDGEKKTSGPTTVFKLGSGSLMPGDIIILGGSNSLPPLPPEPSLMYRCFKGELDWQDLPLSKTVITMENRVGDGEQKLVVKVIPRSEFKSQAKSVVKTSEISSTEQAEDSNKDEGINEGINFSELPVRVP